jgi:periplasmic protein TonB
VPSPEALEPVPPSLAPPPARPKPVAKPKPATKPEPLAAAKRTTSEAPATDAAPGPARDDAVASAGGIGSGGAGGGSGPGGGSGAGLGSGSASPAYGVNPEPPYPLAARRLGLEGTVVLRVVVASDGSPVSVAVLQSSGHAVLDASAADTVRAKWRFVPARRNGVPVEDTVQVPIRFHQTAG